ncbi:hypothetical protein LI7559_10620 [Bacillus licheniformis LMG 7559]|mgnify:CR=1 FL=1|nr:hypothetical protein LI7559_10620 [Bacillus licheniformis LMG 7559]
MTQMRYNQKRMRLKAKGKLNDRSSLTKFIKINVVDFQ